MYREIIVTWGDLTGSPATDERLVEVASKINAEAGISVLSGLGTILHNRRGDARTRLADQVSAAIEFFPDAVANPVITMIQRGQRHRWLHEEQVLAAMRLLIMQGKPGHEDGPPDRVAFAELLLGINDAIGRLGLAGETPEQELIRIVLRSLGLLPSEQERYSIPRFQDLLLVRSRIKQGRPGALDLDAIFERATNGLTPDEYLAAALIYAGPFTGVQDVSTLAAVNYRQIVGQYEKRFRDPNKKAAFAEQFIGTIGWFQGRFAAQPPASLAYWDYLPFKQRPLIRVTDGGSPIPVSYSYLMQKLATGLYFLLENQARIDDARHGVQRFRGFVGEVFEEYCQDVLARTFAPINTAIFVPEREIVGSGRKPDAVVQQGSSLVVFETTVTALTDAAVVASDPIAFEQEIRSKLRAKADQLREAIEGIAYGRLIPRGVILSAIKDIYPVLLLLYPFPHIGFTVKPLRDAFSDGQVGRSGISIRTLTLMSAEEMEMVEPVVASSEVSLPGLLRRKAETRGARDTSLKNFLLTEGIPGSSENPNMKRLYDERLKSPELLAALHRLFVFDDDPPAAEASSASG